MLYLSFLQVSGGSDVHFPPGNFSLHCHVQKEVLPHGNEHLLNWATKKYRAVTSFSELKIALDIYIKVGEGVFYFQREVRNISLKDALRGRCYI